MESENGQADAPIGAAAPQSDSETVSRSIGDQSDTTPLAVGADPRLVLSATDIIGVWDGDLVAGLVYGDANFARIYGCDPIEAALGVPRGTYLNLIHRDDVSHVRAAVDMLFSNGGDFANEHRIIRPDGTMRWVMTRGRILHSPDGSPIRFAGVSVDITDRKAAEARQAFLLELSDRLRLLTDPQAIITQATSLLGRHLGAARVGLGKVQPDDETIVLETNYVDGVAPLFGARPMATFGEDNVARNRQGLTIVHDDLAVGPNAAVFSRSEVRSFVSVPLLRDGRLRATLFVSHVQPRAWSTEDVHLVEGVATRIWDALERAWAEESLRQLNASLEEQVESRRRERDRTWRLAPTVMVVGGPDGTLLEVNPAWTRILGWTAEETIGRDVMVFVAPEDRESGAAGMAQLFQGIPVVEFPLRFLTRSGERRRIAWTTVPEGGRLYGYGRDVTAQSAAEEQLRQAQKMEAVGQLTGGLAHDFNNLLTSVIGSLELLRNRVTQGRLDNLERYISPAQEGARRAAALTHRLLAFSRRQTLEPQPTSVDQLVAGMEDLVRRSVGPTIEIRVATASDLWTTLVDPHQLENALLNLCINARDAMPDGGILTIESINTSFNESAAYQMELAPGDYVALRVTDTGTGMTPEVIRRAFDPFFTTKPLGQGTGLGLSMIYGFARQSGGHVRIQSQLGSGTTVAIFLPRHADAAVPNVAAETSSGLVAAGCGERVLVVDDEPTVRLLVCEVLADLGYTSIEAADGASGLGVLRSAERIDLLITDVGLPGGVNGRQLADAGRRLRPGLRVLFITGYAESAAAGDGAMEPGMRVLSKPFSLDALADRIRDLLSGPDSGSA